MADCMKTPNQDKDLVEVVRCEDCAWYAPDYFRDYLGWCAEWETAVRKTGYCHNAERKDYETD